MNLTVPTLLVIVALILALVDELRAEGRSLTGWAVVFVCISLLYGNLNL